MTYGYSDDLRKSCLSYYDKSGKTQKEVAFIFSIGLKTLSNWINHRKRGDYSLRVNQKKRNCPKLDQASLLSFISQFPDAYLHEIAEHFNVTIPGVHYAFKRCGITRKKNNTLRRERREKT